MDDTWRCNLFIILVCPKLWDQILGVGRGQSELPECQNGPGQGWAGIKLTFCQILHNDSHPSIPPSLRPPRKAPSQISGKCLV